MRQRTLAEVGARRARRPIVASGVWATGDQQLLSIVLVVHRHGGRAWGTSVKDEGVTFSFTLGTPWTSQNGTAAIAWASACEAVVTSDAF
jgi:hypothetical protein